MFIGVVMFYSETIVIVCWVCWGFLGFFIVFFFLGGGLGVVLYNRSIWSCQYLEGGLREKIRSFKFTQKYNWAKASESLFPRGKRFLNLRKIIKNYDVEIIEKMYFYIMSVFLHFRTEVLLLRLWMSIYVCSPWQNSETDRM